MLKFYIFILMGISLYGDICVTANSAKEAYEKVEAMPSNETIIGTVRVSEIDGKTNTSTDVVVSKAFMLTTAKGKEFCFSKSIQNAKLGNTDLVSKNIPTEFQTLSPYRDYSAYFNTMISKFADNKNIKRNGRILTFSAELNTEKEYRDFLTQMDIYAKDALHIEDSFLARFAYGRYPNLNKVEFDGNNATSKYYQVPFFDTKGKKPYTLRMYNNVPITERLYLKIVKYDEYGNSHYVRVLLMGAGLISDTVNIGVDDDDIEYFFEIEADTNQPYFFVDTRTEQNSGSAVWNSNKTIKINFNRQVPNKLAKGSINPLHCIISSAQYNGRLYYDKKSKQHKSKEVRTIYTCSEQTIQNQKEAFGLR